MDSQLVLTLITTFAVIVMFLSGKIRFGFIGIFAAVFLYTTGVLDFAGAFGNLASTAIVLTGSMYILAGALNKTSLVDKIRKWVTTRKGSGRAIIFLYLFGVMMLAQFITPLTVLAMMLPFIATLDEESPVHPSTLLLAGAIVAHASQYGLPGGNGSAWFAVSNGRIESFGGTQVFQIFDICKVVAVPAIVSLLYMTLYGAKRFPHNEMDRSQIKETKSGARCTPKQEKMIYIIFILTILGIALSSYLPVTMYTIVLVSDLLLVALKLMDHKDVTNALNLDALFMVAGLLSLANAMASTGAASWLANVIIGLLGGNPSPITLLIVFYMMTAVITQLMSNNGSYNVFVPLAIVTALERGLDPRAFVCAVFVASNAAMLTPMSSPSIAIAISVGRYKLKDVFRICFPLWAIYSCVAIFMCNLVFPVS